jgi:hypothetical protein
MKELNNKLDGLNELITRIDAKILDINTKLDELIKALHDYDDDLSYEPQQGPCSKHDEASWDEERMNIIGQNGNTGLHYTDVDENEFNDYGERVNNNTQTKHTGETKKRNSNPSRIDGFNKRKYYKPKQSK